MNRLGITCALHAEASAFTAVGPAARQVVEINGERNGRVLLLVSGMGPARARQAARQLVEAGADCLLSVGLAGALAPALRPGDLVAPQRVFADGNEYAPDAALPAPVRQRLSRKNVRIHTGALVSVAQPLASVADKRQLCGQTGAIAVDMESAAVLEVAQRYDRPALALRVILDAAHAPLPGAVLDRVDEFGRTDLPGLLADLLTNPGQVLPLLRLAGAARRAARTMRLVARECSREWQQAWSRQWLQPRPLREGPDKHRALRC